MPVPMSVSRWNGWASTYDNGKWMIREATIKGWERRHPAKVGDVVRFCDDEGWIKGVVVEAQETSDGFYHVQTVGCFYTLKRTEFQVI